jgi:hypothetical protein
VNYELADELGDANILYCHTCRRRILSALCVLHACVSFVCFKLASWRHACVVLNTSKYACCACVY